MFELYGMNKDGMVYRSPPPRRKEVDILETCLQLPSPELMRKLPNGDAIHHAKDSGVSTSFDKNKDPPRESGRCVDAMIRRTERVEEMDSDDWFLFPWMCSGRRCWITFSFGTT
uniref:Uncharacterized protein n=1 Tax=Apis cerana TaxID=7461 RepID=V9IAW0_APICE